MITASEVLRIHHCSVSDCNEEMRIVLQEVVSTWVKIGIKIPEKEVLAKILSDMRYCDKTVTKAEINMVRTSGDADGLQLMVRAVSALLQLAIIKEEM